MRDTILVTGGAGFIGSALVRHMLSSGTTRVANLDKLTYAASPVPRSTNSSRVR